MFDQAACLLAYWPGLFRAHVPPHRVLSFALIDPCRLPAVPGAVLVPLVAAGHPLRELRTHPAHFGRLANEKDIYSPTGKGGEIHAPLTSLPCKEREREREPPKISNTIFGIFIEFVSEKKKKNLIQHKQIIK